MKTVEKWVGVRVRSFRYVVALAAGVALAGSLESSAKSGPASPTEGRAPGSAPLLDAAGQDGGTQLTAGLKPGASGSAVAGAAMLSRLPLAFVENQGQWETPARFVARRGGMTARFERDGIILQLDQRVM